MRYIIRVKIPSNKLRAKMLSNNQLNEKKKTKKQRNNKKKRNVQCGRIVAYVQVNLTLKSFRK